MLLDIYIEIYRTDEISKNNLVDLAARLSDIAHKSPPWSWRYLNSILKGHKGFKMTAELDKALLIMGAVIDGQHILEARAHPVMVYSQNGNVQEGSIILGRSFHCKHCQRLCVGKVPNQKFCCEECRKAWWEAERRPPREKK